MKTTLPRKSSACCTRPWRASPRRPIPDWPRATSSCACSRSAGFKPELQECVVSRAELKPERQFFSFEEGGVVSRAAAPEVTSRRG